MNEARARGFGTRTSGEIMKHSRRANRMMRGGTAFRAASVGAAAIGAFAVGALAIGALAIGRLVIRRVRIGGARLRSLEIGELTVSHLRVADLEVSGRVRLPGSALPPSGANRLESRGPNCQANGQPDEVERPIPSPS
jgi:hypothetical protein